MDRELSKETWKKLLKVVLPIAIFRLIVGIVNFYIEYYVFGLGETVAFNADTIVMFLQSISTGILVVVSVLIVITTLKFGLFSDLGYKYFSLPLKKSQVIFSQAIPAAIISSVMLGCLASHDNFYSILYFFVNGNAKKVDYIWGGSIEISFLAEELIYFILSILTVSTLIFGAIMIVLLSRVVSQSFDLTKSRRNYLLTLVIGVLFVSAFLSVINTIALKISEKFTLLLITDNYPTYPCNFLERYGIIAIGEELLFIAAAVFVIVVITFIIAAIKKLADNKLNIV